jgi:hypothetical protein
VRLSDEDGIYSRNHAGTGNLRLLALTGLGDYLIVGESGVLEVQVGAGTAAGLYGGSGAARVSANLFEVNIGSASPGLEGSGEHSFFRYHDTLCCVTESARATVVPMQVT